MRTGISSVFEPKVTPGDTQKSEGPRQRVQQQLDMQVMMGMS